MKEEIILIKTRSYSKYADLCIGCKAKILDEYGRCQLDCEDGFNYQVKKIKKLKD